MDYSFQDEINFSETFILKFISFRKFLINFLHPSMEELEEEFTEEMIQEVLLSFQNVRFSGSALERNQQMREYYCIRTVEEEEIMNNDSTLCINILLPEFTIPTWNELEALNFILSDTVLNHFLDYTNQRRESRIQERFYNTTNRGNQLV